MSAAFDKPVNQYEVEVDDDSITVTEDLPVIGVEFPATPFDEPAVQVDAVANTLKTRAERIADKYEKDCAAQGVEVGFSSIILGELFGIALREGLKCLKVEHSAGPQAVKSTVSELSERDKARVLRSYAVRIRKATRHEANRDKSLTKEQRQERIVGSYHKAAAMAQACLDDVSACDDGECCEFCTAVMPSV